MFCMHLVLKFWTKNADSEGFIVKNSKDTFKVICTVANAGLTEYHSTDHLVMGKELNPVMYGF